MTQWQPIDTAPRDGTWFLICCAGAGRFEGYESYEIGRYDPLFMARYTEVEDGLFKKEMARGYEWSGFNNFHRATHWRFLPAPPTTVAS